MQAMECKGTLVRVSASEHGTLNKGTWLWLGHVVRKCSESGFNLTPGLHTWRHNSGAKLGAQGVSDGQALLQHL